MKKNIALIGYMGTGKTTLGKKIARRLEMDFIDTDQCIEKRQGRTITEIFETEGEAVFRKMERDLLKELCEQENLLISTGGGIILDPINRKRLKEKTFLVTLTARPGSIYKRVKNSKKRPLLQTEDLFGKIVGMMKKRRPFYEIGHIIVKTDTMSEGKAVTGIIEAYDKFCKDENFI